MLPLDAWRPVALERKLGFRPLPISLQGRELVLFRDGGGRIGALEDRCIHRGMRLSCGRVRSGRLTCPYHGWWYDRNGRVTSPSQPTLDLKAPSFETATRAGFIWIRAAGGLGEVPDEDEPGLDLIHSLVRTIEAPLPSVMDNFTEVEHTGIAHWQFGYDPRRLGEIVVDVAASEGCVRVRTEGPQRPLWFSSRLGFGIREGMRLVCEWETSFSPPRSVWRWHWTDPHSGERTGRRFKAIAYFNAVTTTRTQLLTYYYWSTRAIDRFGFGLFGKPLIRMATAYEVSLDAALIEGLCRSGQGLAPTLASRFDHGLVEQRQQLAMAESAPGRLEPVIWVAPARTGTRPIRRE